MRVTLAAACSLGMVLAASSAHADDCQPADGLSTCLPSDNLWPHPGGGAWLSLAPTFTAPGGSASFGLVGGYLHRPIGLRIASADPDGTVVYAVEQVVDGTFLFALGLADRLQVSAAVPAVLFQEGAGKGDIIGADDPLPRSAVGDLRFGATVVLIERPSYQSGPGLSARFELAAPTGNSEAFFGGPSASYAPGASFDWRFGSFSLGIDAGARLRDETRLAGTVVGSQISASLGASYDILPQRWLGVSAEAFALFTLSEQLKLSRNPGEAVPRLEPGDDSHIPAEWLVSVRSAGLLDGRLRTQLGGGSFIPTGDSTPVTTPAFRAVLSLQYLHAF